MSNRPPIYLATVCLDRNRWGSKQPAFRVSDWLERFATDGFAGIELWEHHFIGADEDERTRLIERAAPVAIYNTYATFTDDPASRSQREAAARAITQLQAGGVKYNLGGDASRLDEYRGQLLAWADELPGDCRLLCECHPGTVLEPLDAAAAFFAELDPKRFAIIAHLSGEPVVLGSWLAAFGSRVQHLHLQLRKPEQDPSTPAGREALTGCVALLGRHGFAGSVSIEFTRGIGRDEQIETLYANACADMAAFGKAWN